MMLKKYTIVFPSLMLFTALNFEPFFIIDCTGINGNSHLDNIFNGCCTVSMSWMNHSSQNPKEIFLVESHFNYFIEITSEEYLIVNNDNNQSDGSAPVNAITYTELAISNRIFQTNKAESHPISINLVRSEVILI